MFNVLKRLLIGRPLENKEISSEKFGVFWGLPILSSDAISSVAYAGQEILIVLLPAIGMLAFRQLTYISLAIITLLMILVLSYRQIIDSYPNGGGAFVVAKENLGIIPGVTAGSALSIDYILTVSVSISSGIDQIVSAIQILEPFRIPLCIVVVILMTIGNLRGIKESARIFSIPTYLFIFSILFMLTVGFIKALNGYTPEPVNIVQDSIQ
ncbi:MAG: amino acid permease, partial [Sphingobacteriia bacterium]|nr:amino acid permease [Sphingobacteriia bacterium]